MKVLHVLETSVPELVGYTIRGRYIVEHQRQLGLSPMVVTSPFFRGAQGRRDDEVNGIRYFRSNHIPRPDKARGRLAAYWTRFNMLGRYRKFVAEIAARERVDVIHAHSSYTNGLAADYASRQLGIPFIYELRTLWGERAIVEEGWTERSLRYRMVWRLELRAMHRAKLVVPIARGIRDAIVSRGIEPAKIAIVPNGVDTTVFQPVAANQDLVQRLGLQGAFVVGFIGSLGGLEGIPLLIDAFKEVHRREPRARLVIVGAGPERDRLSALTSRAGLDRVVDLVGVVPHEQVRSYYSVMDVLAYPRIDARINQTVTPLKPLEAMAMGKVCLASDVGGLRELIEDDVTGVLFEAGNVRSLTEKILRLASDRDNRERLARQALEFVRREREWSTIASRYKEIYLRAGARPASTRPS